jgi:hypothetical protein
MRLANCFPKVNHTCNVAMVLVLTIAFFTVARVASAAPQRQSLPDTAAFVVSIGEATIDHKEAVTSTDCIMVSPDGRFHLERRKQVAPNPTSSLNIYESSLDSTQLQQLLDIVKKESITTLPDYALPAFPMAVPWFSTFNAKVERAGQIRTVGYWLWRGGEADDSPNSTPNNIKKIWKDSEVALQPLAEWLHGIEALKLSPSNAKPTQCEVGGNLAMQ